MLLRRITQHIKNQNWFAIFIDFIIVVLGVFIGIQVANWNEKRILRDKTEMLTERLASDFGVDMWLADNFYHYNETVIENAKLVLKDITGRVELTDEKLIIAAFRATQFNRLPISSTYKELIATGDYDLLAKSELGKLASVYYEGGQFNEIENDGKNSDYRRLFRSLIPIEVQLHVAERCGDRNISTAELIRHVGALSYDCQLDLTEEQIALSVELLRSRSDFVQTIRLRIANLSMQNNDFKFLLGATESYRASEELIESSGVLKVFRPN